MSRSTFDYLSRTIAELINCDAEEVSANTRLVDDLGFESIDFLELGMLISQSFKLDVDEQQLFLSEFRLLINGGSRREAMDKLSGAYPHLAAAELESLLDQANSGNILKVGHLESYIQHFSDGGRTNS